MPSDLKYLLLLIVSLSLGASLSHLEKASQHSRWNSEDIQISTIQTIIEQQGHEKDIVFLGTSRTMNGIDAPRLNEVLEASDIACLNLGINWFGHGMHLSVLEAWLEDHQPLKVVLEVPMLYHYEPHPHLTFHLSPKAEEALWSSTPQLAFFPSMSQGPRWILQNGLPQKYFTLPETQRLQNFGFLKISQSDEEQKKAFLSAQIKLSKMDQSRLPTSEWQSLYRKLRYAHQNSFLKAISELCAQKNVPLVFLIIPKCGFQKIDQNLKQTYLSMAPLWVPPESLLQKAELWRDGGHLNTAGAKVLADWLAKKIQDQNPL